MLARKQGRLLRVLLALNLAMFLVEAVSGIFGRSSALLGDSLDMLGDAAAFGATLYVLRRGGRWKARATLLKAGLMALTAASVLMVVATRTISGAQPSPSVMGVVGGVAFGINALCFGLLTRRRADDINMASAWACARNDLVANVLVVVAGLAVAATRSSVPDVVVGVGIATLYVISSVAAARAALRSPWPAAARGVT